MQVLVIHGAGGFINVDRADFVAGLRARKVTLEDLRRSGGDWKSNLQRDLGPEYDVLQPRMPDADAPQYAAWAAWFEQILPLLDSEVILVGHSLGALFLAKYLSENKIANKVHSLHLCAAPYTGVEAHVMLQGRLRTAGWLVDNDFALLAEQCGAVYLYHSTDDPAVPFAATKGYTLHVPQAVVRTFSDLGHLRGESLPGIVDDIKG